MSIRRIAIFAPLTALFLLFSAGAAYAQTVGAWDSRAAVSATISSIGNLLAYPGSGDLIYQRRGSDNTFNSYSISGNSWAALAADNCGAGIGDGSFLVRGDSGFLYASCPLGTPDFVYYNISTGIWATRTASPSGFGSGASAVWDGSDYIYVLPGSGLTDFYRYSISGNSWTDLLVADPPASITYGGSLAYPGSGDFIYAFRGGDTATFYRYSISDNSWTTLTAAPRTNGGGSSLVAADTSSIYAICGACDGVTTFKDFWRYNIGSDSWTTLTDVPADVGAGGALAYVSNSSGTFIYQLRGKTTTDFNRYTISLASTGGSAGSAYLLARQDAGLSLARGTPPASPTNVIAKPTSCNGTCGATIAFSYAPLGVHQGRPLTFTFIDETGQQLGSLYEPFAGIKSYTFELKDLAPNSPINGRLCAQFGPGSGCTNVQSWTLFSLDQKKITLRADVEGDHYRVRINIPSYPNEGVEMSGVRMEITADGKKVSTETVKSSGETAATLPPGNYAFTFTPINARGVLGASVTLPLALKPFGEALTLDVGARVADGLFASGFIASSNRLGNNGFELLMERRGEALQFTADKGAPVEVRLNLTATLVSVHTTKVNGAVASEKEQFTFVFSCVPGGACKPVSSLAQKGNVVTRAADIREGLVTAKTLDATVTANMNGALAHATISAIGKELSGLEGALELPANRLRGGKGEVVVTVGDALGNKIAKSAPISIAGVPARITLFDITALTEPEAEGDVVARAIVDYRDFSERALLLNLSFAEEAAITAEPFPTVPRLVQVLITRDDGTGVQFALPCEESCGIGAVAAPRGEPLEVTVEENPDGTARASASGVTLTYDAQNALPLLVGTESGGFSRAELRARYASFGFGNIVGELRANEEIARAAFAGTGGYLNLFPEVIERVILDLAPLIINYIAPQNLAPVIESVLGARVVSRSRPVEILKQASDVGAPVSPLLNVIRNLFTPETAAPAPAPEAPQAPEAAPADGDEFVEMQEEEISAEEEGEPAESTEEPDSSEALTRICIGDGLVGEFASDPQEATPLFFDGVRAATACKTTAQGETRRMICGQGANNTLDFCAAGAVCEDNERQDGRFTYASCAAQ